MYIAGRITGDPGYREKFEAAKRFYEDMGHIVLNPAELPEGMRPEDYMRICFAMIDSADKVCFLLDWKRSKGAKLEMAWCEYVGKPYVFMMVDDRR